MDNKELTTVQKVARQFMATCKLCHDGHVCAGCAFLQSVDAAEQLKRPRTAQDDMTQEAQ